MVKLKIQNRQTFEDYLLENFNQNEGKYFTIEELSNSYNEQTEGQKFMYDSFKKSIIFTNNVLGNNGYFVEEKLLESSKELLYAKMPIDNPVSKSIIPVDILSRGYQEVSDPLKQHELFLRYYMLNEDLMKSSNQLKLLHEKYGIEKVQ